MHNINHIYAAALITHSRGGKNFGEYAYLALIGGPPALQQDITANSFLYLFFQSNNRMH